MELLEHYKLMLTMRHFEEACLKGVPTGEIHGELHTGIGQEAIGGAMAGILRRTDALVSTHRNHLHAIAKGVRLKPLLAEIFERSTGLCKGRGGHMHPFDLENNFSATGIVGSAIPVALGYAYAFAVEGNTNIAVAMAGDGAANTGAFHESMNIAGAWKLPLVIIIENNQYAISVKSKTVSATPTLSERAGAYSAWGATVDGSDITNVIPPLEQAVEHARTGNGPAILEATCYRFRGHYEGDHDSYRSQEEKSRAQESQDPLEITRCQLIQAGIATDSELQTFAQESKQDMLALLESVRRDPAPDPSEVFKYLYC
jgi:acetoin:2,6-dichlorophenolindophenol oxidoreductase subunit alpha